MDNSSLGISWNSFWHKSPFYDLKLYFEIIGEAYNKPENDKLLTRSDSVFGSASHTAVWVQMLCRGQCLGPRRHAECTDAICSPAQYLMK